MSDKAVCLSKICWVCTKIWITQKIWATFESVLWFEKLCIYSAEYTRATDQPNNTFLGPHWEPLVILPDPPTESGSGYKLQTPSVIRSALNRRDLCPADSGLMHREAEKRLWLRNKLEAMTLRHVTAGFLLAVFQQVNSPTGSTESIRSTKSLFPM